jgi:autotransporter-associated beta strand protein
MNERHLRAVNNLINVLVTGFVGFLRKSIILRALFLLSGMHVATSAFAANGATWNLNPSNGDWDTDANWTPTGVPRSRAMFDMSNITDLTFSRPTSIGNIIFNPAADSYSFTSLVNSLSIQGGGVTNNSGAVQNFVADADDNGNTGFIVFHGATAGNNVAYRSRGRRFSVGGSANTQFQGGSADQATFTNEAALASGGLGGALYFFYGATAGQATITNEAGTMNGAPGGVTAFTAGHGGNATIINQGALVNGAGEGTTVFDYQSDAESATLIAKGGGLGGSGGGIKIMGDASGGQAIVKVYQGLPEPVGMGYLDISGLSSDGTSIGSLEGTGFVYLGSHNLTVGDAASTSFFGIIQDTGSLTKVGTGTLTLIGANTYTGGTKVSGGTLLVATRFGGSGTGTGDVTVASGTLGGTGTIAGAVAVRTGAFLVPAEGFPTHATLTIQGSLTFSSMATYTYTFEGEGTYTWADKVVANGVTINSHANLNLSGEFQGRLQLGVVLTVIENTALTPIVGTFSNLPDGAVVNVNGNNLQVSYEGHGGNDLTLTVVP